MLIICGKTCSGKNYLRDELLRQGIEPVVTYTTRPIRPGEEDGRTYHYLNKEEFEQKQNEGFFFESTRYRVADGSDWFYGSHFDEADNDKMVILNPIGIEALKNAKPAGLSLCVVYVDCPEEILKERQIERGDKPDEAARRLLSDRSDFAGIRALADITVVNDGTVPLNDLVEVVRTAYEVMLEGEYTKKKSIWTPQKNKERKDNVER